MQVSVDVSAFNKFGISLEGLDLSFALRDEIGKIAYRVERFAKQLTPVDTGRLRASIHTQPLFGGMAARVSTRTEYAVYVHEGTRYMRSRPFMTTAVQFTKGNIEGDVKARIDSEFVKAFKSL